MIFHCGGETMEKKRIKNAPPFSDAPILLKFAFLDLMLILAILIVWVAMLRTISVTQSEKYREMENTVITAAEQITNMSVESAVSIAKNLYTNDAIYNFLNTRYPSPSAYYEAYYPLQKNTALNTADTNIVSECIIYTENPTIPNGGSLQNLDSARDEYWYKRFQSMNKPTILCIDTEKNTFILVRKLDYLNLETGESYLCLSLNPNILQQFADNLGFDGQLYIMSSRNLLYSSDKSIDSVDSIIIGSDFSGRTRNYYTSDIEFYSCANKKGIKDFLAGNKDLLVCLGIVIATITFVNHMISFSIIKRIKPAVNEFRVTGSMLSLRDTNNGKDEVGKLLDVCSDMSERMLLKGSEYQISSDTLVRKESDYDALFTKAMRIDAELAIMAGMPEIRSSLNDEYFFLSEEAGLIKQTAEKYGASFACDDMGSDWKVPAYSFALIAADAFVNLKCEAVGIYVHGPKAAVVFMSRYIPNQTELLKLRAIFEDISISNEYTFDRNYRYNPYLRLRHCMGTAVNLEISEKNRFRLAFILDKYNYKD